MVHKQGSPLRANVKLIFLVEDDTDIVEVLVQIISYETPYDVAVVSDGIKALKVVKGIKPHLFILDYMLPGMNGLELYDQLRGIEEVADVPTIILSASLPVREVEKRKIVGIGKPFELDILLNTIDKLLA
jgi:DNA-binding response OmpR family regulator